MATSSDDRRARPRQGWPERVTCDLVLATDSARDLYEGGELQSEGGNSVNRCGWCVVAGFCGVDGIESVDLGSKLVM